MPRAARLIALLALGLPLAGLAEEVYRRVDKDGRVIFSDKPAEGAEPVTIRPPNSMQEVAPRPAPPEPKAAREPGAAAYTRLAITTPANGATITNPGGAVSVGYVLEPALRPGHSVRLLVDGSPAGGPVEGGGLEAAGLARGDHALEVQVVDGDGNIAITSGVVRITLFRPNPKPKPRPVAVPR